MLTRRDFNLLPLLGAALGTGASAQAFPSRPIRFVAAFSPGSGTDGIARFMAQHMARSMNGQVLVDNKVGAGGMLAADFVAKSPPDGYNVLFISGAFFVLPFLGDKPPYDAFNDFAAVAIVAQSDLVIAVAPNSPFQNMRDIIAEAKKKPGSLTYSTSGSGTSTHMGGALLNSMASTTMRAVHYKVASQASIDAAMGEVSFAMSGTGVSLPLIKSGRLRAIATTGTHRSSVLPDVPTVAESGVADYELLTPTLAFARAGTPKAVLASLSKSILVAAATPEYKAMCTTLALEAETADEVTLSAAMSKEFARWKTLAELAVKQG